MKPEEKHFQHGNSVISKTASVQKSGAGKKFGAPSKTEVKENKDEDTRVVESNR